MIYIAIKILYFVYFYLYYKIDFVFNKYSIVHTNSQTTPNSTNSTSLPTLQVTNSTSLPTLQVYQLYKFHNVF